MADRLQKYHAKRDFTKTPEPKGTALAAPAGHKRAFCVQKHLATQLHYDFRLEHNGVLLSWAVPKGPSMRPADKRLAMETEAHPLDYGDFEGVIGEGYGAGVVMLWDRGDWEPQQEDVDAALAKGELKFRLHGEKLQGSWALIRTARPPRGWLLIKHRDDWATDTDITTASPRSVKSGGDFADIVAAQKSEAWQSGLTDRGGAAGEAMREIIAEAHRRVAQKQAKRSRDR